MDKLSKIYIAGHAGLVGSAIKNELVKKGFLNLIVRTHSELNLIDQESVDAFFKKEQPEIVILAAARVGGILANNTYRADFIYQNIMIQSNIINASWKFKVKKLLFLGSTCIYPKDAPQPLKEEYLLTSALEYTNEPYAIAKIAGLKMCESFNLQYQTNFISVMPTNLYGPGDNFDLEKSHVLPALLRKIHLGKCLENNDWPGIRKDLFKNPIGNINGDSGEDIILRILDKYGIMISSDNVLSTKYLNLGEKQNTLKNVTVNVWGTGTPLREFMYSLDMAEACVYIIQNIDVDQIMQMNQAVVQQNNHPPHFLNIGTGKEISIKELSLKIKLLTGFNGEVKFDISKPDGTMRKVTDVSLLNKLGYTSRYDLDTGLAETYRNYLNNE